MICPRCDHSEARKIFDAPENAVWTVHHCPRCDFVWRNTEELEVTDPVRYDTRFKLSEEILTSQPEPN